MQIPQGFTCPDNMRVHLKKVFEGEYDVPLIIEPGRKLTILDIGANCGAFALWASARWPGSEIYCYEPMPDTYKYLEENIRLLGNDRIYLERAAICGTVPGTINIYPGKNNIGEASLFKARAQQETPIIVPSLPPSALPVADIIKLDIEGAELEVLHQLLSVNPRFYSVIMLEYHSEAIRRALDPILRDYAIIKADIADPGRGTLCYVHAAIVRY